MGLIGGLLAGLIGGLKGGGTPCVKHIVLRLLLAYGGMMPINYIKFLDYAADRILLRKVGGGYMFIHRMLLEYFAARYVEPGTMPKKDHSSGRTPTRVNRRLIVAGSEPAIFDISLGNAER